MSENLKIASGELISSDSQENPEQVTFIMHSYLDGYALFKNKFPDDKKKNIVSNYLQSLQKKYNLDDYFIILLYDEHSSLDSFEANKIYEAALKNSKTKGILLVLNNLGGKVESAYLISKTCKELSKDKFVVSIPRRAKSAATLIAFGADEIHMGLMSELGPIDPQIAGYPALSLGNSLEVLAKLSAKHPESSIMFANYLSNKLDLKDLGYFERISESAAQYAERLLKGKQLPQGQDAKKVAEQFVYHYKDHGFVIDIEESTLLLGELVKKDTNEYKFGNDLFLCLSYLDLFYQYFDKKYLYFIGTLNDTF
jgi:hypothetical protein